MKFNIKKSKYLKNDAAFTLLEVMAAMAILAIVLVAVFNAQSQSLRISTKAQRITTAMNLAQARMGELEFEVLEKGFEYLKDEDKGKFEDDRFSDYRWAYTSDSIKIPVVNFGDDSDSASSGGGLLKTAQEMLEKSIREVRLSIFFTEGTKEESVEIVTHFSNPKGIPLTISKNTEESKDSKKSDKPKEK